jgi:hypothetical protein
MRARFRLPGLDIGLDQQVGRIAQQDEMLRIVAPDEHESPPGIQRSDFHDGQSPFAMPAFRAKGRGDSNGAEPEATQQECQQSYEAKDEK